MFINSYSSFSIQNSPYLILKSFCSICLWFVGGFFIYKYNYRRRWTDTKWWTILLLVNMYMYFVLGQFTNRLIQKTWGTRQTDVYQVFWKCWRLYLGNIGIRLKNSELNCSLLNSLVNQNLKKSNSIVKKKLEIKYKKITLRGPFKLWIS